MQRRSLDLNALLKWPTYLGSIPKNTNELLRIIVKSVCM